MPSNRRVSRVLDPVLENWLTKGFSSENGSFPTFSSFKLTYESQDLTHQKSLKSRFLCSIIQSVKR